MSDRIYAASSRAPAPDAPPVQAGFLGDRHSTKLPFWKTFRSRAFWQTARSQGKTLLNRWRTSICLPLAGLGLVTALVIVTAAFALSNLAEPGILASGDEIKITKIQIASDDTPISPSECPPTSLVVSEMLPADSPVASPDIWRELAAALSAEHAPTRATSEPPGRRLALRRTKDLSAAPFVAPELMEQVVVTVEPLPAEEAICSLDSCDSERLETAIVWQRSAVETFREAIKQEKLVFIMHVSGNFALPEFT